MLCCRLQYRLPLYLSQESDDLHEYGLCVLQELHHNQDKADPLSQLLPNPGDALSRHHKYRQIYTYVRVLLFHNLPSLCHIHEHLFYRCRTYLLLPHHPLHCVPHRLHRYTNKYHTHDSLLL